jgi:hypothetical protein
MERARTRGRGHRPVDSLPVRLIAITEPSSTRFACCSCSKGEILGTVEAPDVAAAKAAAAVQFGLDEIQRGRIMVQEFA